MSKFGWSLPPGVRTLPGEEISKPCVDCYYCDEEGHCKLNPNAPIEEIDGLPNVDYCPIHGLVKKCDVCHRVMNLLIVDVKYKVDDGWGGAYYCCSAKCKDKKEREIRENKEILQIHKGGKTCQKKERKQKIRKK